MSRRAVVPWGARKEAVRQAYPKDTENVRRTKTWRHHASKQPRGQRASVDGETVGLDGRFSNGADRLGDYALGPAETCSCHCRAWAEAERRPGKSEDAVTSLNRNIERRSETSLPRSSLNP